MEYKLDKDIEKSVLKCFPKRSLAVNVGELNDATIIFVINGNLDYYLCIHFPNKALFMGPLEYFKNLKLEEYNIQLDYNGPNYGHDAFTLVNMSSTKDNIKEAINKFNSLSFIF